MPTADEEAQERAFFEDEEEEEEVSSSSDDEDTDDEEDEDEATPQQQQPPPTQPAAAPPLPAVSTASDGLTFTNTNNPAAAPPSDAAPSLQNPNPSPATTNITAFSSPAVTFASAPNGTITVHPIAAATPEPSSDVIPASFTPVGASTVVAIEERKPLAITYDESRRLFQRLWTDDDEIKILQGFFEFTAKRGTTFASHQYDTGPFYEDIKKQLNLEFTKNQLIEKIRRLKKKFRNCCGRMHSMGSDFQFKSAHERAIYEIAKNIWNPSTKRARDSDDDEMMGGSGTPNSGNQIITVPINEGSLSSDQRGSRRASRRRLRRRYAKEAATAAAAVGTSAEAAAGGSVPAVENSIPVMHTPLASVAGIPSVVEETLKSCLSPLFKELINSAIAGGPLGSGLAGGPAMSTMFPLSLGGGQVLTSGAPMDEKWREQQILELEVYLKRVELVRDQIKRTLEELKSSPS